MKIMKTLIGKSGNMYQQIKNNKKNKNNKNNKNTEKKEPRKQHQKKRTIKKINLNIKPFKEILPE